MSPPTAHPLAIIDSFATLDMGATLGGAITAPNAVTVGGYMAALWWLRGGPQWAAAVSIAADEVDGRLARALGQSSMVGSNLDWSTDVTLAAMTARKLGMPDWAIAGMAITQSTLRSEGWTPPVLSARAVLMIYGMWMRARYGGWRPHALAV